MSSGNKLSISICDDNGNLSYQKQFRVRRILQRGVIDSEQGVSLDMEDLGYNLENNKWVLDEDKGKGTGKYMLIAEYDSGNDDETDIGFEIPMTVNLGLVYHFDDSVLYSKIVYTNKNYFALVDGNNGEWVSGEKCCLEAIKSITADKTEKFEQVKIDNGTIYAKAGSLPAITNRAVMFRTFKGKRWLCVLPVIVDEIAGLRILFRRKINGGLIRYFVVEVEE